MRTFFVRGVFSWSAIAALYPEDTYTTEIDSVEFGPITFCPTFPFKETKDSRFTSNTFSRRECQNAS
jgi:hypothetical protein